MENTLTSGALADICRGEIVVNPIVQVLGHKAIQGSGQERYRLLLSDGQYSNSFSMLATQLNYMLHDLQLEMYTIVKIRRHITNQVMAHGKKILIILDLEVVQAGRHVRSKIGNPVQLGSDGSIPPLLPVANPNSNPNNADSVSNPGERISSIKIARIPPVGNNNWTTKAKVMNKSDIRTWGTASGTGKLFSMDLKDESGEIRITAFKEQCDEFYDKAVVGKEYYFSNCAVKAANKLYSNLNNEYEMFFEENSTMELAEAWIARL